MNKNTKLWLGAGIVGVGAYLLFKSKKATSPALTASSPANLVGFDTGKFYDVKGGHAGVKDEGIFTNADGFAELAGKKPKKKGSVKVEDLGGEFVTFANQPFNFGGSQIVGERKVAFADAMGDRQVAADGVGGRFFEPETRKFTRRMPTPKRTLPVEPVRPAVPLTQPKPVNNFASAQGAGMINSFSVKSGFDPLVNR